MVVIKDERFRVKKTWLGDVIILEIVGEPEYFGEVEWHGLKWDVLSHWPSAIGITTIRLVVPIPRAVVMYIEDGLMSVDGGEDGTYGEVTLYDGIAKWETPLEKCLKELS